MSVTNLNDVNVLDRISILAAITYANSKDDAFSVEDIKSISEDAVSESYSDEDYDFIVKSFLNTETVVVEESNGLFYIPSSLNVTDKDIKPEYVTAKEQSKGVVSDSSVKVEDDQELMGVPARKAKGQVYPSAVAVLAGLFKGEKTSHSFDSALRLTNFSEEKLNKVVEIMVKSNAIESMVIDGFDGTILNKTPYTHKYFDYVAVGGEDSSNVEVTAKAEASVGDLVPEGAQEVGQVAEEVVSEQEAPQEAKQEDESTNAQSKTEDIARDGLGNVKPESKTSVFLTNEEINSFDTNQDLIEHVILNKLSKVPYASKGGLGKELEAEYGRFGLIGKTRIGTVLMSLVESGLVEEFPYGNKTTRYRISEMASGKEIEEPETKPSEGDSDLIFNKDDLDTDSYKDIFEKKVDETNGVVESQEDKFDFYPDKPNEEKPNEEYKDFVVAKRNLDAPKAETSKTISVNDASDLSGVAKDHPAYNLYQVISASMITGSVNSDVLASAFNEMIDKVGSSDENAELLSKIKQMIG